MKQDHQNKCRRTDDVSTHNSTSLTLFKVFTKQGSLRNTLLVLAFSLRSPNSV